MASEGSATESEEDEEEGSDVEYVSYLEDPPTQHEKRLLTRRMFPSKVGGRPAWLVPDKFPSEQLVCRSCSRPLRFLLQVYASREKEKDSAFHRGIHLFVCTSCNPNRVRLFRAQMPRENPFYSPEPPDAENIARSLEKTGDCDIDLMGTCCMSCGLPFAAVGGSEDARQHCKECARLVRIGESPAVFEERELSTYPADSPDEDDAEEDEKEASSGAPEEDEPCGADADGDDAAASVPPSALESDPVAEADAVIATARLQGASASVIEKLGTYRKKVLDNPADTLDASEESAIEELSRKNDPVFSRFSQFSESNSGHVLRYVYRGQPLWFSQSQRLEEGPPPCELCGAERIFEFQVQPQLIALLGSSRLADRLDYGTICCYVCADSCDAPDGQAYSEEFAYVQPEPLDASLPKG